jgi:hypothetical protein
MTDVLQWELDPDTLRGTLWQFDSAERLQSLINQKYEWYLQNYGIFFYQWYSDVFDLRTANEFGLSVWAIILDLPLFVEYEQSPTDYPAFGFEAFGGNFFDFNFATTGTGVSNLTMEQKRVLLRLRFYQITTRAAVPEINKFLAELFGGLMYVVDNLNMTMTYIFTEPPSSSLMWALQEFDVLPRPAGVEYDFNTLSPPSFGFAPYQANFFNSNFGGTA